jgi:membrane-bound lytic murein transglycosylase F
MRWGLIICCSVLMATCAQPPSLLDEILALGELRVITRNSPTTFYTGSNGPEGPEYDLVTGFATFIGVQLKLETADRFSDLIRAVESGQSHIAAAGLTITPERAARVDFGPSYHDVRQYLIYKLGTGRPRTVEDLLGKKLEVVSGTSYVETLKNIQSLHPDLVWTENPHADLAELLVSVSSQEIDYTIADSSLFKVYQNYVPEIRVGFELTMGDSLAWAFPRRNDRSLIERAEQYVEFIKKNGDLDRVKDRYYGHTKRFDYVGTRRFIRDYNSILPRYRQFFEQAAKRRNVDWRLLAAIGYQESRWDPMAISPTGVRGIMMLTQNTANVVGIDDRVDAAQSISGGAKYLEQIKRRLPATIKEPDRTWFALASYNVGYGHVQDARMITEQMEKEPDLWVHVKKNLPLLTQHSWYAKSKHGYARGWEPVMYVENIRNYYDILIWLTEDSDNSPEIDTPTVAMQAEKNQHSAPVLF